MSKHVGIQSHLHLPRPSLNKVAVVTLSRAQCLSVWFCLACFHSVLRQCLLQSIIVCPLPRCMCVYTHTQIMDYGALIIFDCVRLSHLCPHGGVWM